jgi:hypothetical protein
MCLKYLQYTCTKKNRWNIGDRRLQHTCTTIATYEKSRSTFATSVWNNWNIHLKQLKYLKYRLATCLKNIQKHLKHSIARSHDLPGGELRWRKPPFPANGTRWMWRRRRRRPPLLPLPRRERWIGATPDGGALGSCWCELSLLKWRSPWRLRAWVAAAPVEKAANELEKAARGRRHGGEEGRRVAMRRYGEGSRWAAALGHGGDASHRPPIAVESPSLVLDNWWNSGTNYYAKCVDIKW